MSSENRTHWLLFLFAFHLFPSFVLLLGMGMHVLCRAAENWHPSCSWFSCKCFKFFLKNLTWFWLWVGCILPLLCWDISCISLYSLGLLLWKSARFVSKINYHISVTWLRYTNPSASDLVFNAAELSLWLSWTSICWQIIHYVILSLKCWLSSVYAQDSVLALCEIHRDTHIFLFLKASHLSWVQAQQN